MWATVSILNKTKATQMKTNERKKETTKRNETKIATKPIQNYDTCSMEQEHTVHRCPFF